jgi:hypothetical protein
MKMLKATPVFWTILDDKKIVIPELPVFSRNRTKRNLKIVIQICIQHFDSFWKLVQVNLCGNFLFFVNIFFTKFLLEKTIDKKAQQPSQRPRSIQTISTE